MNIYDMTLQKLANGKKLLQKNPYEINIKICTLFQIVYDLVAREYLFSLYTSLFFIVVVLHLVCMFVCVHVFLYFTCMCMLWYCGI